MVMLIVAMLLQMRSELISKHGEVTNVYQIRHISMEPSLQLVFIYI